MREGIRRLVLLTVVALLGGLVAAAPAVAAADWHITEDTTLTQDFYGAIFIEADDVTLDCAGFAVYPDGDQIGISIDGFDRVTVANCVVDGGEANIHADLGDDLHFIGNTLLNANYGLVVRSTNRAVIENNHAEGNSIYGFVGTHAVDGLWNGNTAEGVGDTGIALWWAVGAVLTGNTVTGADNLGFYVHGATGLIVDGNTAVGNRIGFAINLSTDPIVTANNALRNREAGFGFWVDTNLTMTDNKANNNGGPGINLNSMEGGLARGNSVVNNQIGFLINWSESLVLESNTARNNGYGIVVVEGLGNTVVDNKVVRSDNDGIRLEDSADNLVSANTSDRNGRFGFSAAGTSTGNTFSLNSACRNGVFDADDSSSGVNIWTDDNDFCTTSGF